MKFFLAVLFNMIFGFIAGVFLPWWGIALVCLLSGFFFMAHLLKAFLAGFTGIFLLWGLLSLWIDIANGSILSQKIAHVFPLGGSSAWLILITAMAGAITGGFASMAGSSLHPFYAGRYGSKTRS